MKPIRYRKAFFGIPLVFVCLLFSCATIPERPPESENPAYRVQKDDTLLSRFAPVFVIEKNEDGYNRIGTVRAAVNETKREHVLVDSEKATVYTRITPFETAKDKYKNLVYRIHFEKVPFRLIPFNLTAGENVGLLVIVTLNGRQEPVLYTMVHTCGCYLSFVPTSHMEKNRFPEGWTEKRQVVYGENLPGILDYGEMYHVQNKTVILIRAGTHRVKDIWLASVQSLEAYRILEMKMLSMNDLERLPLIDTGMGTGTTTSFFETSGPRKDYVKGSHKPLERLLMSWWALDWRIGEDKKFGKDKQDKQDGIVFYTSLKPWDRKASDMRDFIAFLRYWGWRL